MLAQERTGLANARLSLAPLRRLLEKTNREASAKKLVALGAEWETHRRPLIVSHREHKTGIGRRKEMCRRKLVAMKRMRGEMKAM